MIPVKCDQGSPEWHQARAGVITASMFSEVRKRVGGLNDQQHLFVDAIRAGKSEDEAKAAAGYKSKPKITDKVQAAIDGESVGDFSDTAKAYGFRLAIERLSGEPLDEGFETWAMKRGHELEKDARLCHEEKCEILVEQTGFVLSDDRLYGASADGLIDDDGGSEYKCLVEPARLRKILVEKDISEFTDQVQGCMWIGERQWWHFCLYCPALKSIGKELTVIPVQRDEQYIAELADDLAVFNQYVEKCVQQLLDEGHMAEEKAAA